MLDKKISRLKKINLNLVLDDVITENKEDILEMNRDQMYEDGVMNVNRPRKRERYSPATIQSKKRASFNRTDHVTLKWTGQFHETLVMLIFKTFYLISSKDLKWANYLEPNERFANALGLTEKSMERLRKRVKIDFVKRLRNEL